MTKRILQTATIVFILPFLCSCQYAPVEASSTGALPEVMTPIGPLPGPASEPKEARNPYQDDPVALAEGRQLFVQFNCSGCHGGHAGGGMGPSLRDQSWIYGDSPAHIFSSIAEGRAHGMPSWGRQLPESEIWKLVAYVKSLRTPEEPSPPI